MNCREWKERINAHADGELPATEAGVVSAHLAACPECRRELDTLLSVKRALSEFRSSAAFPAEAKEALLAEARRLHPSFVSRLATWLGRCGTAPMWKRYAAGVAVCGAAFLSAYAYYARRPQRVSIDVMLAAHSEYALTKPLAPQEAIFARLPERLNAADQEERADAL